MNQEYQCLNNIRPGSHFMSPGLL